MIWKMKFEAQLLGYYIFHTTFIKLHIPLMEYYPEEELIVL